jgi:DNA-binding NarL/FixJ family response regulator
MAPRARLVLADDHELIARGLEKILMDRYDILGVAHSGTELLEVLAHETPDCVLLDISMPDRNGLEILPELRAIRPNLKVLMLTMYVDRVLADTALSLGANGFVPKNCGVDELCTAIEEVLAGHTYVSPAIPRRTDRSALEATHPSLAALTPRQHQILRLLGEGKSTAGIADTLALKPSTVSFHRANIRKKLGIDSEWGLIRYAVLMRADEADGGPRRSEGTRAGGVL